MYELLTYSKSTKMKALFSTLTLIAFLTVSIQAQQKVKSPPQVVTGKIGTVDVTIDYSSPSVKGRTTWGGQLVPFDKVWRTGANAATWIETSGELEVAGNKLPAGKYSVFTIPKEDDKCTIIFNKEWDQWGHYKYNESKDALRVEVDKLASTEEVERLAFEIDESAIILKWDDWHVAIDVK